MQRRFVFLTLLGIAACGSGASEHASTHAAAIVNGTTSGPDDDAVVLILTHVPAKDTAQGQYFLNCTGTLLAPDIVLTARHCLSETSDGSFTCDQTGALTAGPGGSIHGDFVVSDTHVWVGPTLGATVDPASFPGAAKAYIHDAAIATCNADLALIVLQTPIQDAKVAPIRLDGDVTKDEALVTVGWGATVASFIPPQRQRRDGVRVVDVGPSSIARLGGELGPSEFLASESVCVGDSGGPAFDADTGAVVGVVSRGPNGSVGTPTNGAGCVGTQHTFEKASSFKALVLQAFAATGETPWLEGAPAPGTEVDAGAATDAAQPSTPTVDAGSTAPQASPRSSSGCTAHGAHAVSGWNFGVFAAALAFFVRLRRRRPTAK
jgi:hypothetical protein